MTSPNGAYISGLFNDHQWVGDPTQAQMVDSSFNLYVFWAMHVDEHGNLFYNNEPLMQDGGSQAAAHDIRKFITQGRASGALQKVYFSVGGWGVGDFLNIEAIFAAGGTRLANFQQNLMMLKVMGVNGVDFDYEETIANPVRTITRLTTLLYEIGMEVTFCPYTNETMWIECLKSIHSALDTQPVQGFNLQCYAGGAGNSPQDWVDAITAAGAATGVQDPANFVRPGLAVAGSASSPQMSPSEMTTYLQNQPGNGAWIWNTEEAMKDGQFDLAEYAQAITAGC